jgi:HEAT repeat protein
MHGTVTRWILAVCLTLAVAAVGRADPLATKNPDQEHPDAAQVAALVRQLGDNDFYEREAAAEALEDIGEPNMEELRKVSETHSDLEIRHRAAVIVDKIETRIGLSKGPASSDELIGHLRESKYPGYREWAAQQLAYVHDASRGAAVEALLAACKSDSAANVRVACIKSLEIMKMGTPSVLEAIKVLKKDADATVRDQAIKTYAHLPRLMPATK